MSSIQQLLKTITSGSKKQNSIIDLLPVHRNVYLLKF